MKLQLKALALVAVMLTAGNAFAQRMTNASTPLPASFNMIPTHVSSDFSPYAVNEYAAKKRKKRRGHDQAWDQGKSVITAGYGFPNVIKRVFKVYESELDYKVSGFGPAYLKFDYGINEKIGLGVSIRYLSYKVQWTDVVDVYSEDSLGNTVVTPTNYTSGYKGSSLGIMARLTVHFATGDKIDPYWGVGVGYGNYNFKYFTDDPNSTDLSLKFPIPLAFESTIGIRYFFTDNIGAYAETGIGGSYVQLGLAAKF